MFFQESEAIATENLDLRKTVEQVDHLLATILNSAPLRAYPKTPERLNVM
jgi:hypothetical protein